jgi:tetratricopeptide (TPR) repeat protein
MKRTLVISLLVMTALVLGLVGTALLRAVPGGLPAPDPAQPIHLADGTTRPLFEVLRLAHDGVPLPDEPAVIVGGPDPALTPEQNAERAKVMRDLADSVQAAFRADEGIVFHLAEVARREGRLDEAEALYLSIPEDDPRWARAQRRIAWDILAKGRGEPRRAVIYAKKALAAEPFDANSWQDFARVCAGTLGIDAD